MVTSKGTDVISLFKNKKGGRNMLVSGKIEVFKNKKGYPTGTIKSFDKDGNLVSKYFVAVNIRDEKLTEKLTDGKTLTLDVETGYLDSRKVELEEQSFVVPIISIVKATVVSVYPEEKKTTTKKTTKKSSK